MEATHQQSMPRTTHALQHNQRTRLVRSTRKVGAILGETPLFVDRDPTSPRISMLCAAKTESSRRSAYIYAPKRIASVPEDCPDDRNRDRYGDRDLSAEPAHQHPRPVLAVRVTGPSSGPSTYDDLDSPPASASTTLTFSLVPPAPKSAPSPASTAAAARKMARVVRTLGKGVPPDLVFPPPPSPSPSRRVSRTRPVLRRRRTASADALESASESDSANANSAFSQPAGGVRLQPPPHSPLPASPDASADAGAPLDPPPPIGLDRGTHRTEKGWSGEWVTTGARPGDMQNMDDVAKRLRAMRLR
ncbi:hypothetical protein GGX14DRAFT_696491 [Mycena pura]|uniref:Uncharacterized protein n=1 Tax=Mycena pura TaxID=153505 RepID=A0AAD6VTG5_9AGAR|nr:hypothetical protein GGX14DRAFT_696491 [Mycena pura]